MKHAEPMPTALKKDLISWGKSLFIELGKGLPC